MPAMIRRFRIAKLRRFARPTIFSLVLAAFVVSAVGIPVPVASLNHAGQAFPCQAHGCGCDSAEHCWRRCCCHTLSERLAWAKRNQVEVPVDWLPVERSTAVTASAPAKPTATKRLARPAAAASNELCGSASTTSPLLANTAKPKPSCCSHKHAEPEQAAELAPPTIRTVLFSAVAARQCQGQGNLWAVVGASLAPPVQVNWTVEWPYVEQLCSITTSVPSCAFAPPVPPPRAA